MGVELGKGNSWCMDQLGQNPQRLASRVGSKVSARKARSPVSLACQCQGGLSCKKSMERWAGDNQQNPVFQGFRKYRIHTPSCHKEPCLVSTQPLSLLDNTKGRFFLKVGYPFILPGSPQPQNKVTSHSDTKDRLFSIQIAHVQLIFRNVELHGFAH